MPIILTLERSTEEEISGIPKFVTLTADAPSTIFYTLDGTDPDINSDMYVDVIVMPTTGLTVTLKAQAVSDLESSDVLEVTYSTDQSGLDRTRIVGDEGINILAPGETVVDSLAYDADGNLTQSTTVPVVDLDVKASTTNRIGEDISGNTTLDFVNLSDRTTGSVVTPISSPNDFADFDPQASMIIIDGTTQEKLDEQVVQIINRPYFTMELNDSIDISSVSSDSLTLIGDGSTIKW